MQAEEGTAPATPVQVAPYSMQSQQGQTNYVMQPQPDSGVNGQMAYVPQPLPVQGSSQVTSPVPPQTVQTGSGTSTGYATTINSQYPKTVQGILKICKCVCMHIHVN